MSFFVIISLQFYSTIILTLIIGFINCNDVNIKKQKNANIKWTEAMDAERIMRIKEAEKRLFIQEQTFGYDDQQKIDINNNNNNNIQKTDKSALDLSELSQQASTTDKNQNVNAFWCYHCASPLERLTNSKSDAILQLLKLRRALYPSHEFIAENCSHGLSPDSNFDLKQQDSLTDQYRQKCRQAYCQSLILRDHETGTRFAIRGCAENFGAVNEKLLQSRGSVWCSRLHDKLDISECICQARHFCDWSTMTSSGQLFWNGSIFERKMWNMLLVALDLAFLYFISY